MKYKSDIKLTAYILLVSMLTLSGCSVIRKATYPPDFIYLDNKTVTSSMQKLAFSMDKIDRVLQQINLTPTPDQRTIIINELNAIEKISDTLGAGTQKTNHFFIDNHINQFQSDVIKVRKSIETDKSNYYQVGKLVGSCMSCHVMRPDSFIL